MQPAEHAKILGIMHLIWGGWQLFSLIVVVIMFAVIGIAVPFSSTDPNAPPMALFAVIAVIATVFTLVLAVPPIIAGYGFLKRKRWSKAAAAISGVLALLSIPIGTALGVYTLWFLFGEKGRQLYSPNEFAWQVGQTRDALHGAPPPVGWGAKQGTEQKPAYVPPKDPPDWR